MGPAKEPHKIPYMKKIRRRKVYKLFEWRECRREEFKKFYFSLEVGRRNDLYLLHMSKRQNYLKTFQNPLYLMNGKTI